MTWTHSPFPRGRAEAPGCRGGQRAAAPPSLPPSSDATHHQLHRDGSCVDATASDNSPPSPPLAACVSTNTPLPRVTAARGSSFVLPFRFRPQEQETNAAELWENRLAELFVLKPFCLNCFLSARPRIQTAAGSHKRGQEKERRCCREFGLCVDVWVSQACRALRGGARARPWKPETSGPM